MSIFLFGNKIAQQSGGEWHVSFAGWNSMTTLDRVNAAWQEFGGRGGFCRRNWELFYHPDYNEGTPAYRVDAGAWIRVGAAPEDIGELVPQRQPRAAKAAKPVPVPRELRGAVTMTDADFEMLMAA